MIEIKLSQGAKPGHGGVLPAPKVSAGDRGDARRADGRGLHLAGAAFARSPRRSGCCEFVARLRELSGGKPTGFKLAIGHPWEWFGIAKAMHETGILPDFIVVDGAEGGTGAAPLGIHRSRRRAAARGADAGAQHAGRAGSARHASASARPAR